MKKLRLLCIPPYEGMYHLMTNIAAQRSDVELIIHMGNLEDGLKAVLENSDNNIDAIISRGGTMETIRRHCDIPACDIIPSAYDVLRTIRLAQGMAERLAIVGFPSIAKQAEMLCDIMQYGYEVHTIHSTEECDACLENLRNQGVQVIVGDMISSSCAQKYGMHGLLIVSGIESVEAAIDSAVEMYRCYDAVAKDVSLFSDLLRSSDQDTLIYTSDGQEYFSSTQDLPAELLETLQQKVAYVIAQRSVRILRNVGGNSVVIQGRLLQSRGEDFCVYRLTKTTQPAGLDKHAIRYLSADSDLPDCSPLEYYLGGSERILATQNACDRYAGMNGPVLIVGARGTGKDRFAHYIYAHSRLKQSSFVMIDVTLLDDRGWNYLLENDNSPLTSSGLSIYFQRMNAATAAQRQQLLIYLKSSCVLRSNRLYFSYSLDDYFDPQDSLYLYLTEALNCLRLEPPQLSQRLEDIPTLVGLYINAINVQYGTRVAGLTREAMLLLQNQAWPRNVDQLLQAVRDLVINANTSYISEEQVENLLKRAPQAVAPAQDSRIRPNATLDELVHEIVLQVYKEENMNQTHTAKRLGISRSTLWRMLK